MAVLVVEFLDWTDPPTAFASRLPSIHVGAPGVKRLGWDSERLRCWQKELPLLSESLGLVVLSWSQTDCCGAGDWPKAPTLPWPWWRSNPGIPRNPAWWAIATNWTGAMLTTKSDPSASRRHPPHRSRFDQLTLLLRTPIDDSNGLAPPSLTPLW